MSPDESSPPSIAPNRTCALVFVFLLGLTLANIFGPYLAGIPIYADGGRSSQISPGSFFNRDVSYTMLFNPVRDFIRHYIDQNHRLPLWSSDSMFGLPLTQQAEVQLFNPLEWLSWIGGRNWWVFLLCTYLAAAGLGIFLICDRLLRANRLSATAAAAIYALTGAGMYSINNSSQLISVLALPFVVYYSTSLVLLPGKERWNFAAAVCSFALLFLCGQPQYIAVEACGLAAYFVVLFLAHPRRFQKAFPLGLAAVFGLLITAPQNAPFAEAYLRNWPFPSGHALTLGPNGWWSGWITMLAMLAPHVTGLVDFSWYQPVDLNSIWTLESFQIGFGLTAVFLLLAGLAFAFARRNLWRDPAVKLQWIFSALGILFFAYVLVENIYPPNETNWPLHFVHLSKYSPPILAVFFVLNIPGGFSLLSRASPTAFAAWFGLACLIPLSLTWWLHSLSPVTDGSLLLYSQMLTFAAPLALLAAAGLLCFRPPAIRRQSLPLLLFIFSILDCCIADLPGLPLAYDYFRIGTYVFIALILFVSLAWPGPWRRIAVAGALLLYLGLYGVIARHIVVRAPNNRVAGAVQRLMAEGKPEAGRLRILGYRYMISHQQALRYDLRSLVNFFAFYPLATQGYYFRGFVPDMLSNPKGPHAWMNFYGPVDSDAPGSATVTWKDYVRRKQYFDLLGVDLLADHPDGELARLVDRKGVPDLSEIVLPPSFPGPMRIFRSETSLGRAFFRSDYAIVPYSDDGSYAQSVMEGERENLPKVPVVEARSTQFAPLWDGLTVGDVWSLPKKSASPAASSIRFDRDIDGDVQLRVKTDQPGLLVLNEQYFPGWKVTVNGAVQEGFRVNSISQGVFLPGPSEYAVEFEFVGSLSRDLKLSLLGLILTLLALAALPGTAGPHPTAQA